MVTCEKVSNTQRANFLPEMCGPFFLQFENPVYSLADNFSGGEYIGGYWEFFRLQSDRGAGMYMQWAGCSDDQEIIFTSPNGFEGPMSPDAFSISVNLFALCRFANHKSRFQSDFIDYYHVLMEYAQDHKERRLILSAVD